MLILDDCVYLEEMRFPISILLIFHFNECALSLTYVRKGLPWINATQYCRERGFMMESNETEIKTWFENYGEVKGNIWLGKYDELTDWAHIKGCYGITIDKTTNPSDIGEDRLLCQRLCKDQSYFSVKNSICLCLHDVTSFNNCNCSDIDCTVVWEHKLKDYDPPNYQNEKNLCIVAYACNSTSLVRKYAECDINYRKMCDDGHTIADDKASTQHRGEILCRHRGSFIKWFTDTDCPLNGSAPHWSSGRREMQTKIALHKYNDISRKRLQKCYTINKNGQVKSETEKCIDKKKKFLCRKENKDDLMEPGFPLSLENIPLKTPSADGVVIGAVLAGVTVTAAVIVLVVFLQRRAKQNEQKSTQSGYRVNSTPSSSKALTMPTSSPKSNLQSQALVDIGQHRKDNSLHTSTLTSSNENIPSNYSLAKPIEHKRDSDNYSFAQRNEPDSEYVYNSDYDHLNSYVKQTGDSDYSISGHTMVRNNDKVGTYDHFKSFERKEDSDGSNSNYGHLPTNTGSDPTYDVSGKVINNEGDGYDHLPSNFKRATTNDYQSTNEVLGGDTADNSDHFK